MPTLAYGLNITKKIPSLANRPSPAKRKTIFDDDDDASHEATRTTANSAEEIHVIGGLTSTPPPNKPSQQSDPNSKPPKPKPLPQPTTSLSATHTSRQHASKATTLSPTIYDYDAIYDTLHPAPHHQNDPSSTSPSARQPKYMAHLLAAAETRKRDALRAKEKMLVREREAEGAEFADKEKFVTGAYVAQQAEVRRAEEEESRREREEERAGRGKGMVGFYRGVLERGERRHAAVVEAAEEGGVRGVAAGEEGRGAEAREERVQSEAEVVGELNKQGKGVVVNDDGQVVDKRQLLSAGLNVAPKPKPTASAKSSGIATSRGGVESQFQGRGGSKQAMRERQTRMLEAQLEQVTKRAADDEEGQKMELERAAKSRKTEGDISSARERYLQRKREAASGKAPESYPLPVSSET